MLNQGTKLTRQHFPATGSPYYYHRMNTNVQAINKVMEEAQLTDEQKKTLVMSVIDLVKNSVRDGIDQKTA